LKTFTALSLNRLGKREIGAMIGHVAGNHALPDTMRQDIIERTDGIPLFVEEMTRAVLEAESEGEARGPLLPSRPQWSQSLQASMPRY
jgi:predicted ATPase